MSKFALVIYGATGFTGRLAALYVTQQYGSTIRWAIAGRSQQKLDAIKAQCDGIPEVLVADSADRQAVDAMVAQTDVVVTFAGPFARYGKELVASCAAAGVGYCDITGETDWVREMIAKHDDTAKASGARIVHLCGHDSLPWDIMAFKLAQKLKEGHENSELARVEFWDDINGGVSGGTVETAAGIISSSGTKKNSDEVKNLGFDPLLKLQSGGASDYKLSAQNVAGVEFADASKKHSAARSLFFMAGVNANAVKRSNALLKYGKKVVYREGQEHPSALKAIGTLTGYALFGICMLIPPIRYLLRSYVLPKPGEGPSDYQLENGYLNITGVGTSTDGRTAKALITFSKDAGYKDTARMAVEAGLAISLEGEKFPGGGVFTPAACQGDVVLQRLLNTGSSFKYF
eukprot:TRINITY_DN5201_c0_g1_i1.p1 TRINITY_DN5201_c0_g1~~TRINITY_DN5201_c0_g1_i1.p1  ORF type:complete len:403 (-),score=77.62 TRINITY_DN5201_c0_g1_i1:381-1589(-)